MAMPMADLDDTLTELDQVAGRTIAFAEWTSRPVTGRARLRLAAAGAGALALLAAIVGCGGSGDDAPLIRLGLDGRPGGRILLAPNAPSTVYVSTAVRIASPPYPPGRAYRTIDGGRSWTEIGPKPEALKDRYGLTFDEFRLLAVDPSRPSTLYGAANGLLLKTTNGGDTWVALGAPRCTTSPAWGQRCTGGVDVDSAEDPLAVAPSSPQTLYVASPHERGVTVLKTTDGGRSWSRPGGERSFSPYLWSLVVDPRDSATIYAGWPGNNRPASYSGLKSADGGRSWSRIGGPGLRMAIDPATPGRVYALGDFLGGISRSDDGGKTWMDLMGPVERAVAAPVVVGAMAIDPSRKETLYVSVGVPGYEEDWLLKSTDAGRSWVVVANVEDTDYYSIAVDRAGRVYVGTLDGLLVCETCATIRSRPRSH